MAFVFMYVAMDFLVFILITRWHGNARVF